MKIGIDVSNHQGNINWEKVKQDHIEFSMIRASYGWFQEDKMVRQNIAGCESVGIPYGLYHYSYAGNIEQAKQEVEGLLKIAQSSHPTYPLVIDMEDADHYKKKNGIGDEQCIAILEYECLQIESAGFYAMIYANLDWFCNRISDPRLTRFDRWLAQWEVHSPSRSCGIWQFTNKGTVNGISGRVDKNIAYQDYPQIIQRMKQQKAEAITYVVQTGDTLSEIAQRYHTTYQELARKNQIQNPNLIFPGQILKI